MSRSLPTRAVPAHPDIDQLRRQAKELLRAFHAAAPDAVAEVNAHYRGADRAALALHDAQLVLARAYGFESWPKLKAYAEGVNVRALIALVKARDLDGATSLLRTRPELGRMGADNFGVIHHAVLNRDAAMVRLLMAHGANARDGVYPYRDATTAHALAVLRGDDEIVRIIDEAERARPDGTLGSGPARISLDAAAERWYQVDPAEFERVARQLLDAGEKMTLKAAAALGDVDWLRARQGEGALDDLRQGSASLLRIAVTHNRPAVLQFLLDAGFDPNERQPLHEDDDAPFTWGMPLQHAAQLQRYEMAETLLKRGADPNAEIYASGTPLSAAHAVRDRKMVALLERYGAVLSAPFVVESGTPEQIEQLLASDPKAAIGSALVKGDADVLRRALRDDDRASDDPSWFNLLEECPRHGTPGHLACLRVLLERVDPNLRGRSTDGQQFGLTTLHNVVARGSLSPEQRVEFAKVLLDAGARLDIRDNLLLSTPLGWASRWDQLPLVKLFLERGADAAELDAESWARPRAWAQRMGHAEISAWLS